MNELHSVVPPATAVLTFALLPSTDLNDGFWFSALIDPACNEILFQQQVQFDEYFTAVKGVEEILAEERSRIANVTLSRAQGEILKGIHTVNGALERLGSVLVPADVVAEIVARKITNLVVIPEAYLLDVAWPALRVAAPNGVLPLFQVNEELAGLSITVSPNWTLLGEDDNCGASLGDRMRLSVMVSDRPAWRPAMRLFGAARQVRDAIERALTTTDSAGRMSLEMVESEAMVSDFLRDLRNSRAIVFFGHGEILPEFGSVLVAHDGAIGEQEVVAGSRTGRFGCELAIICACSGVDSSMAQRLRRRDLAGVHVAMIRGGVGFIVGSVEPLFPVVALKLLENITRHIARGSTFADALRNCYASFYADPNISSPLFWGHIVGFGNGFHRLGGIESEQQ